MRSPWGALHGCALHASGHVLCWGANGHGQLGDGTQQDRDVPTLVPGLGDAVAIGAGRYNTCAVRRERGVVVCWGVRAFPPGDQEPSAAPDDIAHTPTEVPGSEGSTHVELGEREGCSLTGPYAVPRCYGTIMRSGEEALRDYLTRAWIDDTPERDFADDPPRRTESMLLWGRFRAFLREPFDPTMPDPGGTGMRWWVVDQRHPGEVACMAARCPNRGNQEYHYLFRPILLGTESHAFGIGSPHLRGPQGGWVQRLTWIDFVPNGYLDYRDMRFVQTPACADASAPGCEMNDIRDFSAGFDRVCFRRLDGRWYCAHEDLRSISRVPWMDAQVGTLHMGKRSHFACFLSPGGAVRCWGEDNAHGQVGDGTRAPRARAVAILGG